LDEKFSDEKRIALRGCHEQLRGIFPMQFGLMAHGQREDERASVGKRLEFATVPQDDQLQKRARPRHGESLANWSWRARLDRAAAAWQRRAGRQAEEGEAMSITPAECKAARKLLGWSQKKLATKLLIDEGSISSFERRHRLPPQLDLAKLQRLFEAAGVEFTNGAEPGVKLKAKARTIAAGDLNASNDE
jgi:ribosome-binding protein aMBF1 (putative translation factor)